MSFTALLAAAPGIARELDRIVANPDPMGPECELQDAIQSRLDADPYGAAIHVEVDRGLHGHFELKVTKQRAPWGFHVRNLILAADAIAVHGYDWLGEHYRDHLIAEFRLMDRAGAA